LSTRVSAIVAENIQDTSLRCGQLVTWRTQKCIVLHVNHMHIMHDHPYLSHHNLQLPLVFAYAVATSMHRCNTITVRLRSVYPKLAAQHSGYV